MEKILTITETGEVKFAQEEGALIPVYIPLTTLKYNKQPGDSDGKKRLRLQQELIYVWFMYSTKSIYKEYSEKERREEALLTAGLPSNFQESPELKAFIAKYKELNESRILKLTMAAEKAIDKLREYFETMDFTLKTDTGALVNKPSEVIRAIVELDKVATGLEKLAQRQRNEVKEGSTNRGNQEDGWIMDKTDDDDRQRDLTSELTEEDS